MLIELRDAVVMRGQIVTGRLEVSDDLAAGLIAQGHAVAATLPDETELPEPESEVDVISVPEIAIPVTRPASHATVTVNRKKGTHK